MLAMLRRPSILLVAFTSVGLMNCSQPVEMDSGTDVTDAGVHDTGTNMDVQHADVPPTDTGTDGGSATCGTGLGPCNPVTQTGCGTGMACIFGGDGDGGVTSICTSPGAGAPGATCNSADGCLQGFACLGNPGHCTKICCGPGDNETCRTGVGGVHGATCAIQIQDVNFYGCQATTTCDWFAQDCANATDNCQPIDSTGTTTCVAGGTGTDGASCGGGTGAVDCARGFICISAGPDAGSGGVCRAICDPSDTTGDAGTTPDGGVSRLCPTGRHCGGLNFADGHSLPNFGVCVP